MIEAPVEIGISIPRSILCRKLLPEPDFLDFNLAPGHVVLMTDDGTDATPAVARTLAGWDWKVVVLCFPQTVVGHRSALPKGVERVTLDDMSEEELAHRLQEVADQFGAVGLFIHLHPPSTAELNGGIHFPESDRAIVRQIFLAAKYLKEPLNRAASLGRSAFMAVVRLDGALGMDGTINFSPVSGGLFGLVKTLNLEWEPVFCRAVDISPQLDAGQLAAALAAELHDPNRLIAEVAYNLEGRSTLTVEPAKGG